MELNEKGKPTYEALGEALKDVTHEDLVAAIRDGDKMKGVTMPEALNAFNGILPALQEHDANIRSSFQERLPVQTGPVEPEVPITTNEQYEARINWLVSNHLAPKPVNAASPGNDQWYWDTISREWLPKWDYVGGELQAIRLLDNLNGYWVNINRQPDGWVMVEYINWTPDQFEHLEHGAAGPDFAKGVCAAYLKSHGIPLPELQGGREVRLKAQLEHAKHLEDQRNVLAEEARQLSTQAQAMSNDAAILLDFMKEKYEVWVRHDNFNLYQRQLPDPKHGHFKRVTGHFLNPVIAEELRALGKLKIEKVQTTLGLCLHYQIWSEDINERITQVNNADIPK